MSLSLASVFVSLALALAFSPAAVAGYMDIGNVSKHDNDVPDEDAKPWVEGKVEFPAPPQDGGLVPIDVGPQSSNRFAVDERSVTLSGDGVVRYTLVVISPSGARTTTYEGIRCASSERRIYAVAHADGTWVKARDDRWRAIETNTLNRQHSTLYHEYFCTPTGEVESTEQARRMLRKGNPAALPHGLY